MIHMNPQAVIHPEKFPSASSYLLPALNQTPSPLTIPVDSSTPQSTVSSTQNTAFRDYYHTLSGLNSQDNSLCGMEIIEPDGTGLTQDEKTALVPSLTAEMKTPEIVAQNP